jgi:hypothetical protein
MWRRVYVDQQDGRALVPAGPRSLPPVTHILGAVRTLVITAREDVEVARQVRGAQPAGLRARVTRTLGPRTPGRERPPWEVSGAFRMRAKDKKEVRQ